VAIRSLVVAVERQGRLQILVVRGREQQFAAGIQSCMRP